MIISVVQRASVPIPTREVDRAIAAVNRQLAEHFAPWWGMPAKVRRAARGRIPTGPRALQDSCVVYLQKEIDADATLGYHDANHRGIPFGVVSTDVAEEQGDPWSVNFSHEVLELIGDPQSNLLAMGPDPRDRRHNVFHWLEMCDAVQAQTYEIDRVRVQNFVLPLYFTPGEQRGRNDYMGNGLRSFGVEPGGYIGFYDPKAKKQVTYWAPDDQQAQQRFRIKQQLGKLRRASRYRSTNQERAELLGHF
jgi:hypothetical protein